MRFFPRFYLCLLCFSFVSSKAQIPLYVSRQTYEFTKYTGDQAKTTDRYEHGAVTLSLSPSPGCPITYSINPAVFSIGVNQTKSWHGEIMPDLSNIPAPGTSAPGTLIGNYDVHFSRPAGGSGGSIEGGYDCGKCPVHSSGGHHDLIHQTGAITRDFMVYSIKVDIPDSIPCNNGIATVTASCFPPGGICEWTTPSGTSTGTVLN